MNSLNSINSGSNVSSVNSVNIVSGESSLYSAVLLPSYVIFIMGSEKSINIESKPKVIGAIVKIAPR